MKAGNLMKNGALRSYIAITGVATILLTGTIGYSYFVNVTARDIKDTSEAIERAVSEERYSDARKYLDVLYTFLDEKETMLGATINHNDIYNLRLTMGELSARLKDEDKAECCVCLNTLSTRIRQLKQNSVPSLFNVF